MFYAPSLVCNIVICHVDTCLQCLYPFVIPSAWRLQVAAAWSIACKKLWPSVVWTGWHGSIAMATMPGQHLRVCRRLRANLIIDLRWHDHIYCSCMLHPTYWRMKTYGHEIMVGFHIQVFLWLFQLATTQWANVEYCSANLPSSQMAARSWLPSSWPANFVKSGSQSDGNKHLATTCLAWLPCSLLRLTI